MPDFANRLKKIRIDQKVTQRELADYLNVSQNAIFNWENGKREPPIDTISKIAAYFDVTPSYIMGWEDPELESYYLNEETSKIAQDIFENKELRLLFDTARNAEPEDLKAVHNMLLALKRKELGRE